MKLALNQDFSSQFDQLSNALPRAIILSGPRGVGLHTIARQLAGSRLTDDIEPENAKGETDPISGSIKVATIRLLHEHTRGKSTSGQVVIIDDAHMMTIAAQNAFLKLLEEPHDNLHFILTTHRYEQLLPTIRSRAQLFRVNPITSDQSEEVLRSLGLSARGAQVRFIANGLPAEMTRLSADSDYFEAISHRYTTARELLSGSVYEKIKACYRQNDRTAALDLIDAMLQILERSLYDKQDPQLAQDIEQLLSAEAAILTGGSPRLHLAQAVL